MTNSPAKHGTQTLDRGLSLLSAIILAEGSSSLADIAKALGLPSSTAHRLVARLEETGMVIRTGRGRYHAGLGFSRLADSVNIHEVISLASRPILHALARETRRTTHLGIFEDDMVTYLVKEGPAQQSVFTQEAMQLEAYCSAIGKILLSRLPDSAREAYLAGGPFVEMTPNTIHDPDKLREHLTQVLNQGFATDDNEIEDGLFCIAVPIETRSQNLSLAISISGANMPEAETAALLNRLKEVAITITQKIHGRAV